MTTTLPDVLGFILGEASTEDLSRIYEAARQRDRTLRTMRAATVTLGAAVTLRELSPKYLNGLHGTVVTVNGQRGDVELDEKSTKLLRMTGRKFYVPSEQTNYVLSGVPLSCCEPA